MGRFKNKGTVALFPLNKDGHSMNQAVSRISGRTLLALASLLLSCPAALSVTKFEQFSSQAEAAYQKRDYAEAQKNFEQALVEADKLDKTDKRIATTLYNLALVLQAEAKFDESEKTMQKAIDSMKHLYGPEHQRVAQAYMDLADIYLEQSLQENKAELKGRASENYKKGVDLFEKIYAELSGQNEGAEKTPDKKGEAGPTVQSSAADLSNALRIFANFYAEDELYEQAEPMYKRSLELEDFAVGPDDKNIIKHKAKLAEFYCVQGKYKLAEPYFKEALASAEKSYGADSQDTARIMYNYGGLFYDQGSFGDAEVMFKKSLKIFEANPDQNQQDLAQKSIALADVLDMQGKSEEATAVYKKSVATLEKGEDTDALIRGLKQYQKHFLMMNRKDEAGKIAARIKSIKAEKTEKASDN